MISTSWLRPRSMGRVLFPVFVVLAAAATSADEPVDLPTLPGYNRAGPQSLNDRGQAVGQARRTDRALPNLPVLWSKVGSKHEEIQALPILDGLVDGDAAAIGRSGIPVGSASIRVGNSTFFRAVVWKRVRGDWQAVELEPPPGYTDAIAAGVNVRGQAVGWAFNPGEVVNGDVVRSAVVWQPSHHKGHKVVVLETPEGFQSTATGISELGDIVGRAYRTEVDGNGDTFSRSNIVVWRRVSRHHGLHHRRHSGSTRTPVVLPSVPGLPTNTAAAINLFGHVVATGDGLTDGVRTSRALFWKRRLFRKGGPAYEEPSVLPVPEGFTDGIARDINFFGRVAGSAVVREGRLIRASGATIWRHGRKSGWTGEVLDSPEGANFVSATGLNDKGSVVGNDLIPQGGASGALLWKRDWHWYWGSHK